VFHTPYPFGFENDNYGRKAKFQFSQSFQNFDSICCTHAAETPEVHDLIDEFERLARSSLRHASTARPFDRATVRAARALLRGAAGRPRSWLRRRRVFQRLRRSDAHVYPANGAWSGDRKALLRRIKDEVRRAGKSILRPETGTYQQEAVGLYARMGFRPRAPFGPIYFDDFLTRRFG
jgi:hypothetical protein